MRKTRELVIDAEGRDKGKTFILTEMAAEQAELWAARAFNGAARANVEIPESIKGAGIVGVFVIGLKMFLSCDFPTVQELMKEMMDCVQYRPEPEKPFTRPLASGDIDEVATRLFLREEVIRLHTGFTLAEVLLRLTSAFPVLSSLGTSTSPGSSEQSSPAA